MKILPEPVMNGLAHHVPGVQACCVVGGHAVNDCAHLLVTFPAGQGGARLEHGGSETRPDGTRIAILYVRDWDDRLISAFQLVSENDREAAVLSHGPPYIRAHHRMAEAVWVATPDWDYEGSLENKVVLP
jgi:hypothetical protein